MRAVTDAQGHVIARHDFLPFGEEWFSAAGGPGANPVDKRLFTGHERDAELGLDYFGARYYRADVGRFTTGDPAAKLEEYVPNPQRWNRYAYVTNNPLNYTDPDGRDLRWAASVSSQDKKQLTEMLVRVTMKEEGLRALTQIDERRTVFEIQAGQLPSGSEGGHPVAVLGTIDFNAVPVAITIDTQKISSIAPSSDPVHAGGMVTMAHELQHALSFVTAPDNGTSKLLPVAAGDLLLALT